MAVSIKDVAKECGFSKSTVSAVVNDLPCVKLETREKVKKAIKKLGYRPNIAARELITRKKHNIGIVNVVYDTSLSSANSYFDEMSETTYFDIGTAVISDASKTHYGLLIDRVGFSQSNIDLPSFAKTGNVIGAFLIGTIFSDMYVKEFLKYIDNVVVIGNHSGLVDSVSNDYMKSAYAAVEYLTVRNHKRIAFVNGDPESKASPDKLEGYKKGLGDAGDPYNPSLVDQSRFTGQGGYEAFARIWERSKDKPTAAFFSSDELAVGAARFMHEQSIRIPQDISIIGYEDSALAAFMTPPLTTIHRNKHELGHEAFRLMLSRIENPNLLPRSSIVPFSMAQRQSVRELEF